MNRALLLITVVVAGCQTTTTTTSTSTTTPAAAPSLESRVEDPELKTSARACDAGDKLGCAQLGVMLMLSAEDAHLRVEVHERACRLGAAPICVSWALDLEGAARVRAAREGCEKYGSAGACHLLAEASDGVDRMRARWRACALEPAWCSYPAVEAYLNEEQVHFSRDFDASAAMGACEAGDAAACFRAGIAGPSSSSSRAFSRGCALGDAYACLASAERGDEEQTRRFCELGVGGMCLLEAVRAGPLDVETIRVGCERGESAACVWLGHLYRHGLRGAPVDVIAAKESWMRGCRMENRSACEALKGWFFQGDGHGEMARFLDGKDRRRPLEARGWSYVFPGKGMRRPARDGLLVDGYQRLCEAGRHDACALLEFAKDGRATREIGPHEKACLATPAACVPTLLRVPSAEELCDRGMRARCSYEAAEAAEACERGVVPACLKAAQVAGEEERDPLLKRGCQLGDRSACTWLLSLEGVEVEDAIVRIGCALESTPACAALAARTPSPERERLLLQACRLRDAKSCLKLARLDREAGRHKRALELFVQGCNGRNHDGCEGLARMLVDPRVGEVRPLVALWALERGCRARRVDDCERALELAVLHRLPSVERDLTTKLGVGLMATARQQRQLLCSRGNAEACALLSDMARAGLERTEIGAALEAQVPRASLKNAVDAEVRARSAFTTACDRGAAQGCGEARKILTPEEEPAFLARACERHTLYCEAAAEADPKNALRWLQKICEEKSHHCGRYADALKAAGRPREALAVVDKRCEEGGRDCWVAAQLRRAAKVPLGPGHEAAVCREGELAWCDRIMGRAFGSTLRRALRGRCSNDAKSDEARAERRRACALYERKTRAYPVGGVNVQARELEFVARQRCAAGEDSRCATAGR